MIPSFQSDGLLPAGLHWAEWSEILERFGMNSHRRRLLNGCERAIDALAIAGCQAVYLDGSFVTAKETPEDYDACWGMSGVRRADLDPVFLDFSNYRAAQKAKYLGEFFPALAPASLFTPLATYLDFFQMDKETCDPKGIVAIKLKAQYDKK